MNVISRFFNLLGMYQLPIKTIYVYAILSGFVNLSLPLGIQAIINFIQAGELRIWWVVLVFFVLLGIALNGILQVYQIRVVENIQQDIFARSAFDFTYRIPKIGLYKLDDWHVPELANRFFDTITIQKGLSKILIDFSLASFQIVFGLILLTIYSSYFIILAFLLVFILGIIIFFTAKKGLKTSIYESKYKYALVHWLEEIARTHKSFKVQAEYGFHLQKTDNIATNYVQARENHFKILLSQFTFFIIFKVMVAATLLLLGSYLVVENEMNIGQFVAAEIIVILIINSIEKMLTLMEVIYDVLTAIDKIGYVTDLELDSEQGFAEISKNMNNGLAIKAVNIEHTYPNGNNKKSLEKVSFEIPPNATVLIKGETGSGKSTLLQILAGMQPIQNGELLINNIPLIQYKKANFYSHIAVVLPTNQIFEDTIYNNIVMGRPNIEEAKLAELLQLLSLNTFINLQPQGINTLLDSGGRRLPRSIIQKIQIARALLTYPKMLLMEDPLQFLNNTEKNKIIDYIIAQNCTTLVIADYAYWEKKCTQVINL